MVCSWSCCQHRGQHASRAGYSLDWQAAWSAHVHGLVWLVCILGWVVWSGLCGLVCKLGTTKFCAEVLLRCLVHQCLFTENSRCTLKNHEYCESFAQRIFPRLQYSIQSKQTRCIKKFEFDKGSRDRNKK